MSSLLLLGAVAGTLTAQVVTIIIAFFTVVMILYKFAWGPMLALIDERRSTITREFDTIEARQAELTSRLKDYEERIRQIDNEARERMNKAIEEGKRAAAELVETARKQTEDMKTKAENDIRIEVEKARITLRNEMVTMTLAATEKMLQAQLTEDRHRALVDSFLTELESRSAS